MLGKNKKGGWIAIDVAVGTSIAVETKEPVLSIVNWNIKKINIKRKKS